MAPRLPLIAFVLALGFAPASALAYCRMSTCDPNGARCDPMQETDCGQALSWQRDCVGFATQEDGSASISAATTREIVAKAFAAWEGADCGNGNAGVRVIDMGLIPCGTAEYNDNAGNANVVVYRDKEWPHPEGTDNIALTTTTFDLGTGQIYDADIEINTANYHITTTDQNPDYDLLAVLTHETGHFLGLAHTAVTTATMYPSYTPGDLSDRSLAPDDVAAICAVFPPAAGLTDACNPIPRHGFSTECATEQPPPSCAMTRAPTKSGGLGAAFLFGAAVVAARRSRRTALGRKLKGRSGSRCWRGSPRS